MHRGDDVLVARAPAQVPADHVAHLLVVRLGRGPQPGSDRGQEAGRAEAALEAVALGKGLLHRRQRPVASREALDSRDLRAVHADSEQQAGAHGRPIQQDRAGAADSVLAADVRAGQPEVVANAVGQQAAGRDARDHGCAVHGEADLVQVLGAAHAAIVSRASASASRSARSVRTPAS